MKKILFYLKPHTFAILFCLIFLFLQSFCELNLPNYMSNIVNIGIQQNGLEKSLPEAMSQNFYSFFKKFLTDSEKNVLDNNFQLIQTNDVNYQSFLKKYPILKNENIYVLNTNNEPLAQSVFDLGCLTFSRFFKSNLTNYNLSLNDLEKINLSQLYQLSPKIQALSESEINSIRNNLTSSEKELNNKYSTFITKEIYSELGVDLNNVQNNYILKIGLFMLIFTLISSIASMIVSFLSSKIATKTAQTLRHDVFKKVESFSNNEFNKFSTASLITRTTNDITQIQTTIINSIRILFYAPILAVGGFIMALKKSVSMYWTIFLAISILFILIASIFSVVFPKFKIVQKLVDKLNLVTKENLSGMMVIRAFGTQKFEEKRFDQVNQSLTNTDLFINRIMSIMMPAMMLLMNLISVLIIWTGSQQIESSQMQVGDMIAFMQYTMQIIMSFLMISFMFIIIPRAAVSSKRISEVLDTELTIKDLPQPIKIDKSKIKGKVEFKNVSFRYSDAKENVLENISFTALPGKTTAFIGPTGSGKSTLINLIPRFFEVSSGEILIDDTNIKNFSQKDLHDIIGYVPQKGILFSGDIESNLKFGNENASNEELKLVADISQATDFISSNPKGFKREISQNGSNVSGGQRQRLSIARAILKNAPIYIFDDSFSALDLKTDSALRKALYNYTKNNTILIVAQRISTIINADQIIVLNDGKIVGIGSHKSLLKNCEIYKEIALSQLPKEKIL